MFSKAEPPQFRVRPALTAIALSEEAASSHSVLVTGGADTFDRSLEYRSCDLYVIQTDTWHVGLIPDMNESRAGHSSCTIKSFVYVFSVEKGQERRIPSIYD